MGAVNVGPHRYRLPKCPFTEMSVYRNIRLRNIRLPKCPLTGMSVYRNVRLPKMSAYRKVRLPKCPVSNCPLPNCPLPKIPCVVKTRHLYRWKIGFLIPIKFIYQCFPSLAYQPLAIRNSASFFVTPAFWTRYFRTNDTFSDQWVFGPITHFFGPMVFGPMTRFRTNGSSDQWAV